MHMTAALRKAAQAAAASTNTNSRTVRSLALSVHFRQPEFGMKEYEILSRASAFLLSVDPLEPTIESGRYAHLEQSEKEREAKRLKQEYPYEPAGGPPRQVEELGWLEFCPKNFRPEVHCLASSHVLSPWRWKSYYPQDWLTHVKPEHCAYSVEVYDPASPNKALAKFALNPYPIHDPDGKDLAIIHLKDEETALKHMKDLGVQVYHLRENDKLFEKGDEVFFDGFNVAEVSSAHQERIELKNKEKDASEEDSRIFFPYTETGSLIFGSKDRFLASTPEPLPEGLCGGPTFDGDGRVCGIVEGIVPVNHEDKRMAGAASFLPSIHIFGFLDYAEHMMLEQILPKKLYDKVLGMKQGNPLINKNSELNFQDTGDNEELERGFEEVVQRMKSSATPEQADAIMHTVRRERDEVIEILKRDGGDVDDVVAQVRQRTRETQRRLLEKERDDAMERGEIVAEKEGGQENVK